MEPNSFVICFPFGRRIDEACATFFYITGSYGASVRRPHDAV